MRGRVVIAGVGNTSYGRHPGRDKVDLIVEAAGKAIADAEIALDEIDGVFVKIANAAPTARRSPKRWGYSPISRLCARPGGAAISVC